ncbi:hypothetical protein NHX12_022209 [Muraenolepis orangiensis]|uniref:Ig-like domain-containing protein n=1 Tax=Muraenolepis orangiensis TaxID=630683 RepID=A0A9Q0ER55_9TELE|nr:hypothetical protein NHX12_022209 [Muraenolepis orangiensis]
MYFSIVALVLTKALLAEECSALNVTVDPGPVAVVAESANLTLSCLVSQRKWSSGVLRIKQYGNYTRRFPQAKFHLQEQRAGEEYRLLIANVSAEDQGAYTCRVQEIRRHRNSWRASSNGTATTTLTEGLAALCRGTGSPLQRDWPRLPVLVLLHFCLETPREQPHTSGNRAPVQLTLEDGSGERVLRVFSASYLLVKCPESSSGETVTGSTCSSSSSPRTQRKESIGAPHSKARSTAQRPPWPEEPPLPPPHHMLTKVPVVPQRPRKPRRLKNQTRRSNPQRDYQEDSLTYAELELVRPQPERPISSLTGPAESPPPSALTSTTSTIITTMDTNTDTVYAQILFQEKQL